MPLNESSKGFYGSLASYGQTTKCEKSLLFSNDGDDYFVLEGVKEVWVFLPNNITMVKKNLEATDHQEHTFLPRNFAM